MENKVMIGEHKVEWMEKIEGYPLSTKDKRVFCQDWISPENSASEVKTYIAGVKNPSGKPFYADSMSKPLGGEREDEWTMGFGGLGQVVEACDYYEKHGKWPDEK